jgi:diacylglycerol kinase (ATP)
MRMRALFSIGRYYNTASMHVGIVINPISGRRGSRPHEAEWRRAFTESHARAVGITAIVKLTERRGHARELAQSFVEAGCDGVIAMGGDGTVNEVAQALIGTTIPLGILPCGSGDGFAQGLGLTTNLERSIRIALTTPPTAVDVGYAGGRLFLNVAGVGFDATVAHSFAGRSKRGPVGYVAGGLRLVWTYGAADYEVSWETGAGEEKRQGPRFLVGFANSPAYGNGAILAPGASLQDGLLDLILIGPGGPARQAWRARRLFWNHARAAAGIERSKVVRAIVRGESLICHVDGEPFEATGSLEVSVRPRALWVRAGKTNL